MKRIISFLLTLVLTMALSAAPVSREKARTTAAQFMNKHGMALAVKPSAYRAPRKAAASADDYFYVFNADNGAGFVIVSGDDRTEPILAYSDEGAFSTENMPENLQSWLEWYADCLKSLDENGSSATTQQAPAQGQSEKTWHSITPMLKSLWNQGYPYNLLTPCYYESNGVQSSEHSATGCVATAIAQLMYYHKYPEKTIAQIPIHSVKYTADDGTVNTVSLPRIRAGQPLNWDQMCDTYGSANTDEQNDAVAKLMLYIGQAVKMGYGPSSGAGFGHNVPHMLKTIFGYDDSGYCASREEYTLQEWKELIYNELVEGRPVGMSGSSSGGAHAFVVDGYDGEGLFHLNWGWGGGSNGYFLINILNPGDNSGIGASTSSDGYSMGQNIMLNIMPDDGIVNPRYSAMSITNTYIENGIYVRSTYINWTGYSDEFYTGIAYEAEDGSLQTIGSTNKVSLDPNYLVNPSFPVSGLKQGVYKITPVSRVTSDPNWQPAFDLDVKWIEATVDANRHVSLTMHDPVNGLKVDDIYVTGNHAVNNQQIVNAVFSQEMEEYYGELYLFTSTNGVISGQEDSRSAVSCKPGEHPTFGFYFTPTEVGTYHIWISTDNMAENIVGETTVEILATATNTNHLSVPTLTVRNSSNSTIYGNAAIGYARVKNDDSAEFNGLVTVSLWREIDDKPGWYSSIASKPTEVSIPAGGTVDCEFNFSGLDLGKRYGFSVKNETQDTGIWGLYSFGLAQSGIIVYTSDGTAMGLSPRESLAVRTRYITVDARSVDNLKSITGTFAANALFYLPEGADIPSGLEGKNVVVGNTADVINIADGAPFFYPIGFTAKQINYNREVKTLSTGKDGWEAISLPFTTNKALVDGTPLAWTTDNSALGGVNVRTFSEVDEQGNLRFDYVEWIEANLPYVLSVPESAGIAVGSTLTFTEEDVELPGINDVIGVVSSSNYAFHSVNMSQSFDDIYVMNADGTAFEPVDKATVDAFRGYFVTKLSAEERAEKLPIVADDEVTSIAMPMVLPDAEGVIYDLQGRRISAKTGLQKGIYIVDGKKTIIK